LLFRTLATLRTDIALFDDIERLRWNGPTPTFTDLATRLDAARTETRRPMARRSSLSECSDSRIRGPAIISDTSQDDG